jgi:hypothetical protein
LLAFSALVGWSKGDLAGPAPAPPPNVTSGVIFVIVEAETPAFDRSAAEEYGRPEMIFFAVAVPTPGKVSRSFSLALFKSIFASELFAWPPAPSLGCACAANEKAKIISKMPTGLRILFMVFAETNAVRVGDANIKACLSKFGSS